jgi:hypothetical protein
MQSIERLRETYRSSLLDAVAGSAPSLARVTMVWSEKKVRLPVVPYVSGLAFMV